MDNDLIREYKPLDIDYNVQCAVENLKTAYWSNDTEKYAKAFTEADQMIVSAICHYGYIVVKGGEAIQKPNCVTCDHFGKCEGCEKRDEE